MNFSKQLSAKFSDRSIPETQSYIFLAQIQHGVRQRFLHFGAKEHNALQLLAAIRPQISIISVISEMGRFNWQRRHIVFCRHIDWGAWARERRRSHQSHGGEGEDKDQNTRDREPLERAKRHPARRADEGADHRVVPFKLFIAEPVHLTVASIKPRQLIYISESTDMDYVFPHQGF